jgi:hypothetical protein
MRRATDTAALLARTGIVPDEEVGRAVVEGAARALAPFADDGVRAALAWAAQRWPEFTRGTVLPALQDAVGADENGATPPAGLDGTAHARRRTVVAGAAIATLAAAGGWYGARRLG